VIWRRRGRGYLTTHATREEREIVAAKILAGATDVEPIPLNKPYVREVAKVGRNQPCPCGSGEKAKRCCR
jgi:preprotein translocase subunit SecA